MNDSLPGRDSQPGKKSYHILVLEDDKAHADMIRRVFSKSQDTFRVSITPTIREARAVIRDDPVDLIIADWQLPDGKGIDILPRKEGLVITPLVIMTGRGNEQLAVEMMKTGAIDYLVKSQAMFKDLPRISERAIRDWDNIVRCKAAERRAEEATEKYRQVMENIEAGITYYDPNGNILYLNTLAASLIGGKPEDYLGKSVYEVFSRQLADTLVERLQKISDNPEKLPTFEDKTTFPTGTYWLLSLYSPVKDPAGRVSAVHVITTDITKKKKAEQKSLDTQRQLEDILNFLPDATLAIDNSGKIIVWNKAIETLTGVSAQEMLGLGNYAYSVPFYGNKRPILIDIVSMEEEEIEKKYHYIIRNGNTITTEAYAPGCYGGKGADLWGVASPLYDSTGHRVGAIEVIRDITQHKEIERALLASETRYRTLIDTSPDAIGLIDLDGYCLFANRRALSLFGYESVEELIGMNVLSLITPGEAERARNGLKELKERGEASITVTAMRRDGKTFIGEVYTRLIHDTKGNLPHAMILLHDITKRKEVEEALKASEERFRSYVENANDIIYSLSLDGHFTYVSPKWTELLGHDTSEVIGQHAEKFIHPDDYPRCREGILKAIGSGKKQIGGEYRVLHKNGSWQWHTQNGTPVADTAGNIVSYLGIAHDITERKNAEEALRESEARYHNIIEDQTEFICRFSPDGTHVFINDAYARYFGKTREELEGQIFRPNIYPDDREKVRKFFSTLTPAHPVDYIEHRIIMADGTVRWQRWSDRAIFDSTGAVREYQSVGRDVTEQKQVEEALRASEKRFRELSDLLPQGIFEANTSGILTYANRIAFELFGYTEEILEKRVNILNMIAPDDREKITLIFLQMMEGGSAPQASDEFHALRKDGSTFPLSIYASQIIQDGRIAGVRGIIIDITERKRVEEALRESEARYHNIIEDQTEFICRFKPDGTHEFVNGAYARYFGKTRDELEGQIFRPNIFPEDREKVRKFFSTLTPAHPVDYIEHRIIMADGTVRWQRWSDRAIFDSKGIVWEYQSVGRDVTEQKEVLKALRESENKFRNLLDNIPDLVMVHQNGIIVYVNPAMIQTMGITPDEALNTPLMDYIAPEYHERVFAAIRARMASQPLDPYEIEIISPAGLRRWVAVRGTVIEFSGSPASLNVLTDITERKRTEEALRESEGKHRQLFETMAQGVIYHDCEGRIIDANPAAERILGVPVAQMIGKTNEIFSSGAVHEDGMDCSYDSFPSAAALRTGKNVKDVMGIFNPSDDRIHWVLIDSVPQVRDGENAPYQTFTTFEDITEFKSVENALREREEVLGTIMDATDDTVALINSQGTIISINEAGAKRLGGTVQDLTGLCIYDLLPPEVAQRRKAFIEGVFKDGKPCQLDDIRSGMIFHSEIYPVFDPEHTFVDHIAIFASDITEKKRMEDALRESEKRYEDIINNTLDSILIVDVTADGHFNIKYSNPASQVNMGISRLSAQERCLEDLFPETTAEHLLSRYRECAETGTIVRFEETYALVRGARFFSTTLIPLKNSDGGVARIIAISHDITGRRQMESEIRSLNASLEKRVQERTMELKWANEALREEIAQRIDAENKLRGLLDEKILLLKEVHHRVKNNLQIITSLLNLQSRYISDEKSLAVIRESQNRVRAMAMVHEKLYQTKDLSKIDLGDYIRYLAESLFQFYGARARRITLRTDIQKINADINSAIPFGLIINELISNTLKYAFPEGQVGEVAIIIRRVDHTITVLCQDNGIGIPSHMDWRNTPSLGLRLVNSLVEQLNGTIDLDRSAGTAFTLVFPEKE